MEHDIVEMYLAELVDSVDADIRRYCNRIEESKKDIVKNEEYIKKEKEKNSLLFDLYRNKLTNSYFIDDRHNGITKENREWCKENFGYKPMHLSIDHNILILFKCDEDLIAYKLKFEGETKSGT